MIRKITDRLSPQQYFVEFLFILTALFGGYLIIAWSSYSPFDTAWSVSSYQNVVNKSGLLGAWIIDIFFTFFGYAGNLLPFLICIAPIYFIRTKRVDSLTWARFSLRILGFSLLMLGLTNLSTLLLSDSDYYLAGGVLGSISYHYFLPMLGKFALLLLAISFSVLGFVFCSGASLIRLVINFYYWLTMKNEERNDFEQSKSALSEETLPAEQSSSQLNEDIDVTEPSLAEIKDVDQTQIEEQSIRIIGLSSENNVHSNEFEQIGYNSDIAELELNDDRLPQVSIANGIDSTDAELVEQKDLSQMPDFLSPSSSKTPVTDTTESDSTEQYDIPKVKLATQLPLQSSLPVLPLETSPNLTALDDVDVSEQSTEEEQEIEQNLTSNGLRTIPVDKLVELFGEHKSKEKPTTELPTLDLLDKRAVQSQNITQDQINETSRRIEQQLQNFKIKAAVKGVLIGPVVTRYELELQPGIKVSAVSRIDTDLARALTFKAIRVSETIPGKPYIGIETPNKTRQIVPLRDVLDSDEFRYSKALLPLALGKDISGTPIVIDLAKTPHLLVAGSTGSGKSVGINTMILSLLFKVKPEEVKFIMIDPKVVELSIYNDIPHLLTEVVTDMKKAANALRWCVDEMERRYQLLSRLRVRNIEGFNERIDSYREEGIAIPDPLWKPGDTMDATAPILDRMSYIVVIVDEFADLMMQVGKQIEELIARLTQKARAVGIHVILATQRPSVDVITGLIKSNIPSRIAFTVVQRNDSRTILDQNGAEALLGLGDMLYLGNGTTDLVRVHGAFMSDDEVARVADDWRARGKPNYISAILESQDDNEVDDDTDFSSDDELDPLFDKAVEIVVNTGMTSTSFIQRRLKIGFNRAANIMDQLEQQGIVSEMRNGKRELLSRSPDF